MMAKRQLSCRTCSRVLVFIITLLLCSSYPFAAAQEPLRYKIFSLTHISAEQGEKFLSEVKIGTVSKFPGSDTLLITARASELTKATAILTLVDAEEQFAIKAILATERLENLPPNRQIAAKVGNISIGTFSSPPAGAALAKAIIDVHNNAVIIVAPQNLLARIVSAVKQSTGGLAAEAILPKVQETRTGQLPPASQPAGPEEPATEQIAAEPEWPGKVAEPAAITRRYEPEPTPDGEETLQLTLPQTVTIIDLLGLVGKHLQLDFMYDPKKVTGDVTLMINGEFRGPMKVKDLYPLLESVLKFRGFVMSRGPGNIVKIVPESEALDIDPALLKVDKGKVEHGDVIVTRIFQLKYIDTNSAKNFLNEMKLATTVNAIAETGTIIVTGYAYRMPRIEELLEVIDKPGEPKQFRFRQLKYTMAKMLAPQVKALAEQLGTVSITIAAPAPTPTTTARTRTRRPTPARTTTPTPTPTKSGVYLDTDERTNRILMIGLGEQLAVVDRLIDTLDVEQQDLRTLKLYKIEHVDAEEAKGKLQELGIISSGRTSATSSRITSPAQPTPATGRSQAARTRSTTTESEGLVEEAQVVVIEMTNSLLVNATAEQHAQIGKILRYVDSRTEEEEIPYKVYPLENQNPEDLSAVLNQLIQETVRDKEGKIQQVVKKIDEEIIVIPDENTFSLIVYASKKNQEWIKSLIDQLDKRRPMVLIDVTLVEISRTDTFQYDLELVSSIPDLDFTGGMVDTIADTATSTIMTALASATDRDNFQDFSAKGTTGKGFYADSHIHALLTLMQTKDYGRVLAKPKILVNDNETGTISTEKTTYVARSASTTQLGETDAVSTSYTFDEFASGITLDITPHISEGDLLRLEITMDRSTQESAGGTDAPPPDKTTNQINTIVTVPDDSTIILGGILTLDQDKDGGKVPFLGDIPIVGGLFRKIDNSDVESKLYIFVKANILRPSETEKGLPDLTRISNRNKLAFENSERKFQQYRQWPGIKPRPMDPLKVLEAE